MGPRATREGSVICLDASFLVNVFIDKLTPEIEDLWQSWLDSGTTLIAPLLVRYEMANALHKGRTKGRFDEALVQRTMMGLIELPITIIDDDALPFEALALADILRLPATYDPHYLALSIRFDAELWTSDHRLWSAVHQRFAWIHYAPERIET